MDQPANGSGIGQPVRRREDLRLVRGAGRYTADENLPGQVYASWCARRTPMRASAPSTPTRPRPCPACSRCSPAPTSSPTASSPSRTSRGRSIRRRPAPQQERRTAVHGAALSAADRQGALRRRGGGHGGRRDGLCGQGRRRGRSRSITTCCRRWSRPSRRRGRTRPSCTRHRLERLLRCRARRRRGDRRRVRPRRPCDALRDLGAARHRRADGAARRARRLRCRDRTLHRLCRQRRRGAAQGRSRHHPRRAAGEGPRAHAGRRRQFRHPRHDLSRVRAGGLGREKTRPAGEMDQRAPRVVPERLPGARSCRRSGAGARRQGQVSGDARLEPRQSRRPHHQFRHGAEGRGDDVEHLPRAGGAFPRPRHAVQHLADAALSQRRPAGSDFRHGAADRSRRARTTATTASRSAAATW